MSGDLLRVTRPQTRITLNIPSGIGLMLELNEGSADVG